MTPLPTRLRASAQAMRGLFLVSENVPNVRMIYKEDRDRIAAELTEAADALEAGPWMPIETAPKDGTMFLCWVSAVRYGETDEGQRYQEEVSQIDFCQWRTQADIPDCGWFEPFCGQIGDEQDVTLWAPLPVAPGAQVAQEGAAGVATRHPRCGYPYCACVGQCFAASQPGAADGVKGRR